MEPDERTPDDEGSQPETLDPDALLEGLVYATGLAYMIGLPIWAIQKHEERYGTRRPVVVAPTLPAGVGIGGWAPPPARQTYPGMRTFAAPPGSTLPPPPPQWSDAPAPPPGPGGSTTAASPGSLEAVQTLISLGVDPARAESIAATLGPDGVSSIAGLPKMVRNVMLKMLETGSIDSGT